ncbi:MAG: glycoside hydrolase family 20 [Pedobacter sp.]|nr:MAG: glycoside hydrolase family 20 [Pedobacter sp.]
MKHFLLFLFLILLSGGLSAQDQTLKIVPQPSFVTLAAGELTLTSAVNVYVDKRSGLDANFIGQTLKGMGFQPKLVSKEAQGKISFILEGKESEQKDESYRLIIGENDQVIIKSASRKGLLYGLQTLRQIAKTRQDEVVLQRCTISDQPAFSWRAFMLDESRNFQGKEVVKDLLDEMSRLKLNVFHWHLVDDPAWRIEIKRYPKLTTLASKGNFGQMQKFTTTNDTRWDSLFVAPPAQYYTQKDIKEIVAYAQKRGISIIPEIEVPGHVSASVYAYPWLGATSKTLGKGVHGDLYDVTDPKVEEFVHNVLDEIISLFPGGIIHIGGDEANYQHWKDSETVNKFMKEKNIPTYADLQVWAINRMSKYISSKGYRMIGWNEITGDNVRGEAHMEEGKSEKLADGTVVQFWDGQVTLVNKAIEKGFDVVNSDRHHTYLDYPYEVTPLEKAYSFNPIPTGLAEKDKKKILGLGTQMWSEYTPTTERLYFQIFPRIAAYSEVGWVQPEKKSSYQDFRGRLRNIEAAWDAKGYLKQQKGKY